MVLTGEDLLSLLGRYGESSCLEHLKDAQCLTFDLALCSAFVSASGTFGGNGVKMATQSGFARVGAFADILVS